MQKRGLTFILSVFLLGFYITIVMYVFFAILHVDTLVNYVIAITFEIIGFALLAFFILGNILAKPIKTGYFVPLIVVTIFYTVLLDIINLALVTSISKTFFMLANMLLLFVYCVVSVPMYVMGKR